MKTNVSPEHPARARTALASAALIRLVTEIDDNGPIPPHGLACTLPDLTPHQVRHATEQARLLGLVRTQPGRGLCLTEPGLQLAEIYDSAARWARTHNHPRRTCDFITRVQDTLRLLASGQNSEAEPPVAPTQADESLTRLRTASAHWISTHWTDDEPVGAPQSLLEKA
ncbi:regulator [Streptomyces sp. NPDC001455]|uniref:regulator n=1 Tax=Streptomyces sp. NPDC001455 TaxID=3154518 RepID=UPI003319F4E6